MPLGIEDMRVASPMMRASSYQNFYCRAGSGRLNGRRQGRMGGAWCAQRSDRRQWLQIDFGALTKVTRVATQGRQNSVQWVKTYSLSYSRNGITFVYYKENGRTKVSRRSICWKSFVEVMRETLSQVTSLCDKPFRVPFGPSSRTSLSAKIL